ncbi:MAG: helicase-related protein, partial [Mycobacterium sp.]
PRDLAPHEIRARLGAPWIPAADVARFCGEVLDSSPPVITHETLTASWTVKTSGWLETSPAATIQWGTSRVNAYRLIELALNGTSPIVYDTVTTPDGSTSRVKNVAETLAAVEKRQALDARFAEWLWEDPERCDRLLEMYNRRYNAIVPRRFDGSHLTFDGLSADRTPWPWQRDIVWRNVSSPSALCGHKVGAGKTLSMVATAMTLRRLGLATKPMIITPGHLLEQVSRDAKMAYPGAKVLMVTKDDLTPERRKLLAARCATGDWDLVVMTHSGFGLLPVSSRTEDAFLEDQIAVYRQALGSDDERSVTVKNLNKALDRMRQRQAELRDKRSDDGVSFEQLGVDYLMVDEAHQFKSLPVPSRMSGFSLPESKRATDLALKLKWIRERNEDARWGAFFTGTPVSNTLAELYILQLYLNPDRLAELGLTTFDAWAAQFVDWVTRVEVAPDGGSYRMHTRPARFMNTPELRRLFSEFADVRPNEAFTTGAPELVSSIVTVEPTEGQRWFVDQLVRRADALRSGIPQRPDVYRPDLEDNMLWVCGDGRKAALDLSLVGYPTERPPKVEAVAREILARWQPSLDHPDGPNFQIIFCDLGTPKENGGSGIYGKIRDTLIAAGMPPSMVRFVHQAKTDAARAQLFADCRSGKVAVLIGSTPKLGTGVNVQERCAAIHQLDPPWKPAEVEQRDGRGPRPGNRHDTVESLRYVTPGTFDAYSWKPCCVRQPLSRNCWWDRATRARSRIWVTGCCPTPRSRPQPPETRSSLNSPTCSPTSRGCVDWPPHTPAPSAVLSRMRLPTGMKRAKLLAARRFWPGSRPPRKQVSPVGYPRVENGAPTAPS